MLTLRRRHCSNVCPVHAPRGTGCAEVPGMMRCVPGIPDQQRRFSCLVLIDWRIFRTDNICKEPRQCPSAYHEFQHVRDNIQQLGVHVQLVLERQSPPRCKTHEIVGHVLPDEQPERLNRRPG